MKTHGPLITNIGVWFTVLSPVTGLILGLLGAWILE
jgi:hypothetical protein